MEVKGASCNRMIPITGLIEIKVEGGVLSLMTTDATNTLKLYKKDIPGDDFYAVVPIDIFSKLVAKTTAEYISLAVDDGILEITGNGSYRMELPLDEEGEPIVFPSINFDTKVPATYINATSIKRILETNKASLAETMEIPCLTGYCCLPDMIISTEVTFGAATGPKIAFRGAISGEKILPLRVILLVPAILLMSKSSSSEFDWQSAHLV